MSAPQTLRVLDAEYRVLRLLGSGKYEAIGKRWEMPPCRHTGRIWRAAACAACGEATANRMQNV